MDAARVRIGTVRPKSGGSLRVIHNQRAQNVRGCFKEDFRMALDKRGDKMAGYAIVVWDIFGNTTTASIASQHIPALLLPEMAKLALLNRDIRTDCALDITGRPPPDEPA